MKEPVQDKAKKEEGITKLDMVEETAEENIPSQVTMEDTKHGSGEMTKIPE